MSTMTQPVCCQGRFCYLVLPIALLLAMVAADVRTDAPIRASAHEQLKQLRPGLFVSVGMASDYWAEVLSFLRIFERDIDFSCVPTLVSAFRSRMTTLFLQAKVLEETEGDDVAQTGH